MEDRSVTYHCKANLKGQPQGQGKEVSQKISQERAKAAMTAGGTTTGTTGFPHSYFGGTGNGADRVKFIGADARCNEKDPKLLEFPVSEKKTYSKDGARDTDTPARVIYTSDGKVLCGVITHIIADDKNHGSGNFRACDP
jgi:hypothetical protein